MRVCPFFSDEHSTKVKCFMLDIMCPLIVESDIVSHELLDIILTNIVEPNKSQRKNAYNLAKDLIIKCCDTLEPYIQNVSKCNIRLIWETYIFVSCMYCLLYIILSVYLREIFLTIERVKYIFVLCKSVYLVLRVIKFVYYVKITDI